MVGPSSLEGMRIPLWAKLGNADLFCLPAAGSSTEVSTLSDPGRPPKLADGGVLAPPDFTFEDCSWTWLRLAAEIRESSEVGISLGSLSDRGRPSPEDNGGIPS